MAEDKAKAARIKRDLELRVFHLAGQHDQESHGNWAGGAEDLATKKAIEVGDVIKFVPQGAKNAVVVKVTGKARGRGSGITGKRVVGGKVSERENSYQVPEGVETIYKNPKSFTAVEKKETEQKRIVDEKLKAEVAEARKRTEEQIKAEKAQRIAEAEERRKPKPVEEPPSPGFEPSKVADNLRYETIMDDRGRPMHLLGEAAAGFQRGARALETAGLLGDWGVVKVTADERNNGRFGVYYRHNGRIGLKVDLPVGDAAFTFAHEFGHHMDGVRKKNSGKLFSEDPEFQRIVKRTPEWKRWGTELRPKYYRSWNEVWARAIAQWATLRSADPHMQRVLERRLAKHWDGDNFAEIMAYLNKVLGGG